MLKSFIVCAALFVSSVYLSAQEKKEVSIQFIAFPVSNNSESIELLITENKSIPIELPTTNLSPVYKVPPMNQCVLGKFEGNEKEKKFSEYGRIQSTGTSNQLVLVIRLGKSIKEGLKLIPIKYDEEDFGGGQFFMMNTTMVDIGIEMGSSKVGLKPNTFKLIKPKESRRVNGNKQLFITVYFRNKDTITPFYSSTWRLNDKARSLVFFYHDPTSKRIRTHTIRHYLSSQK